MKLLNICNKVIEYAFYLILFLVPLAFTSDTSELFEFNKLWATFILTAVIGTAWFIKMVIKREFRIQKTPLDIPIALFLVSEIISAFVSLDTHTSLWGYYSRFNGGLFSILSYVFLYYAFVSNLRDLDEDKKPFDFNKIYIFLAGVVIFFIGTLVSSQIKTTQAAGVPFQLIAILVTVAASFALLMKAAPSGILKKSLYITLSSAALVVLWGLPSHFGYDPTCLLFRGSFDVSCWTSDFQPRVRIFSTLGQPDWLGAYLAALLPIIVAVFINFILSTKSEILKKTSLLTNKNLLIGLGFALMFVGSYVALLYTQSRSAIVAFWIILPILLLAYFWFYIKPNFSTKKINLDFKLLVAVLVLTAAITFFVGQPFSQLNKFTLDGIKAHFASQSVVPAKKSTTALGPTPTPPPTPVSELGGTDSGTIRLYVWKGAISIWRNNPIFGSGLETFAFAYYQYRPAAHNLTSEWKFLYNKAHNEYLNYLATTGTFGIVTYLLMIVGFLFLSGRHLYKKRGKLSQKDFLAASIVAGYGTILITNFFGFSVVMINILFYIFPAFVFMLLGLINYDKAYVLTFSKKEGYNLSLLQKALMVVVALVGVYLVYTLITYWNADRYYYYGYNFDLQQDYQKAYPFLKSAVAQRPSEPTFEDEFAYNNAVLGAAIISQASQAGQNQQQNLQIAKQLIQTATDLTNQITTEHPNNIVFWKTKIRILYTLQQVDPSYLPLTLAAIKHAAILAPTDADISYNLGVLYGQNGDYKDAISTLQNTIKLKPDYPAGQAYYALGVFYHQEAIDSKGKVVNQALNQKGIDAVKQMIKLFGANPQAQDAITSWEKK